MQLDKKYDTDLDLLKEENRKFTQSVLKTNADFAEESVFKTLKSAYSKACLDAFDIRDKYYDIIESKYLLPPVAPPSGETIDMGAILDKLALDSKADREAHAKSLQIASKLAKKAAEDQTAALTKLKPVGIKLPCGKFDGCKDRYNYM